MRSRYQTALRKTSVHTHIQLAIISLDRTQIFFPLEVNVELRHNFIPDSWRCEEVRQEGIVSWLRPSPVTSPETCE